MPIFYFSKKFVSISICKEAHVLFNCLMERMLTLSPVLIETGEFLKTAEIG